MVVIHGNTSPIDAFRRAAADNFRQTLTEQGDLRQARGVGGLKGWLIARVANRPGGVGSLAGRVIKALFPRDFQAMSGALQQSRESSARNVGKLLVMSEFKRAGLEADSQGRQTVERNVLGRIDAALKQGSPIADVLEDLPGAIKRMAKQRQEALRPQPRQTRRPRLAQAQAPATRQPARADAAPEDRLPAARPEQGHTSAQDSSTPPTRAAPRSQPHAAVPAEASGNHEQAAAPTPPATAETILDASITPADPQPAPADPDKLESGLGALRQALEQARDKETECRQQWSAVELRSPDYDRLLTAWEAAQKDRQLAQDNLDYAARAGHEQLQGLLSGNRARLARVEEQIKQLKQRPGPTDKDTAAGLAELAETQRALTLEQANLHVAMTKCVEASGGAPRPVAPTAADVRQAGGEHAPTAGEQAQASWENMRSLENTRPVKDLDLQIRELNARTKPLRQELVRVEQRMLQSARNGADETSAVSAHAALSARHNEIQTELGALKEQNERLLRLRRELVRET